jgi:mannose-6-phosphate isomerase-like protein (cupin superfamily)
MENIYFENIEELTINNTYYRKVISTNNYLQLVLMSLKPKEEIGLETHNYLDQFFRVEKGNGLAIIGDQQFKLTDGSVIIVPAGKLHNIINQDEKEDLKLYTIYAPPNHPKDRKQQEKPLGLHSQDGGMIRKYGKYKIKYLKLKDRINRILGREEKIRLLE